MSLSLSTTDIIFVIISRLSTQLSSSIIIVVIKVLHYLVKNSFNIVANYLFWLTYTNIGTFYSNNNNPSRPSKK